MQMRIFTILKFYPGSQEKIYQFGFIDLDANDADAKAKVTELLQSCGWTDIFDLGDITSARGTEMMMPNLLQAFGKLGNVPYNFKIVVG